MLCFSFDIQRFISKPSFEVSQKHDDYYRKLRQKYELDKVTVGCKSDLEIVLAVMSWVNNLWDHNGYNVPEKNDADYILDQVINHKKEFRCVEYAVVAVACLSALGIPSRDLGLKREDVETAESGAGHVVGEAYLPSLKKWIMFDPQVGVVPARQNVPLNAAELRVALENNPHDVQLLCNDFVQAEIDYGQGFCEEYRKKALAFLSPYLYYLDAPKVLKLPNRNESDRVMFVPEGAKEPKVFQRLYPMGNMTYTRNLESFYMPPRI